MLRGASEGITVLAQSRPLSNLSLSRNSGRSAARRPPARSNVQALWEFSLALYSKEAVARACLQLQDRRGLDVNLILYCCWRARAGVRIAAPEIARADRSTKRWRRRVIQPLRALRRTLKVDPLAMPATAVARARRMIAKAELEAERVAQHGLVCLELSADEGAAPAEARLPLERLARANLGLYCRHAGFNPAAADRRALAIIAAASGSRRPA